jgi:O-antigen ligase
MKRTERPSPLAPPTRPQGAILPLIVVTGVMGWWAWKSGGYFIVNFAPGVLVLLGLLAALLITAPLPARPSGAARISIIALLALGAWTALSAFWSPAPDVAVSDAIRLLSYALVFSLGAWICLLLGQRMLLSLAPLAAGAALVAVGTLIALLVGHNAATLLEDDATLRYPLGYHNAVAAFFLLGVWPMLQLALFAGFDWRIRGALVGFATLALELAILAQSRGSVFAVIAGIIAFVALQSNRLRALGWLMLAALPAAAALPWLLEVYQHGGGNTDASLGPLRTAAEVAALTSIGSGLLACVVAWREPGLALAPGPRRGVIVALSVIAAAGILFGAVRLATTEGGPFGFVSRHAEQLTAGSGENAQGTRFGLNLRTNRGDFWRVGLDDFADHPMLGEGGGGFRFSYLLHRRSDLQPEDPHSVEILMASELGLPGLLLFGTFLVGAIVAVVRSRRLGPAAAALGAGALTVTAYWLVHASGEWFWSYPSITVPAMFALGVAVAPSQLRPGWDAARRSRVLVGVAAGLFALAVIPVFLSERNTNDAWRTWRSDLQGAYDKLDDAADLNPLSVQPLVYKASIAETVGNRQLALTALDEAEQRRPDEWTLYYLEARVLRPIDPAGAQRALDQARQLDPKGEEIDALQRVLQG